MDDIVITECGYYMLRAAHGRKWFARPSDYNLIETPWAGEANLSVDYINFYGVLVQGRGEDVHGIYGLLVQRLVPAKYPDEPAAIRVDEAAAEVERLLAKTLARIAQLRAEADEYETLSTLQLEEYEKRRLYLRENHADAMCRAREI